MPPPPPGVHSGKYFLKIVSFPSAFSGTSDDQLHSSAVRNLPSRSLRQRRSCLYPLRVQRRPSSDNSGNQLSGMTLFTCIASSSRLRTISVKQTYNCCFADYCSAHPVQVVSRTTSDVCSASRLSCGGNVTSRRFVSSPRLEVGVRLIVFASARPATASALSLALFPSPSFPPFICMYVCMYE